MLALNDLAMIKLESSGPFSRPEEKDTAESGILIGLPDKLNYYGAWSFFFEKSFMSRKELDELYEYWKSKIGQKVYWTALSERGNIIEKDGEKYAFLKFTSLIAEDDPDSSARNVHSDGSGSFGMEK